MGLGDYGVEMGLGFGGIWVQGLGNLGLRCVFRV